MNTAYDDDFCPKDYKGKSGTSRRGRSPHRSGRRLAEVLDHNEKFCNRASRRGNVGETEPTDPPKKLHEDNFLPRNITVQELSRHLPKRITASCSTGSITGSSDAPISKYEPEATFSNADAGQAKKSQAIEATLAEIDDLAADIHGEESMTENKKNARQDADLDARSVDDNESNASMKRAVEGICAGNMSLAQQTSTTSTISSTTALFSRSPVDKCRN